MIIVLVVAIILYVGMMLILSIGIEKAAQAPRVEDFEPTVSVIVAARNEEQYIQSCIESLSKIDYPSAKLEIIIVNDGSTDRTAEIVESYTLANTSIKMITTSKGTGNLRGKANALSQGIGVSSGEILMFTDADCIMPQSWVKETVQYFKDNVGIVGGFTLLKTSSIFDGMQALDWVFLFGLASASAGLKKPLSVIGNNLSVRRSAYDDVGGFQQIPFSVTEDYALVQAIITKTQYEVAFPINKNTTIQSVPCRSIKQLFRQKQRWGVGGLDMILWGMMIMFAGWLLRISLIASFFLVNPTTIFVAVVCMLFIDFRFLRRPLQQIDRLSYLKYFVFFELYYFLYVPLIPVIAILSKDVVWKERRL